jgi:hypothetical protein
MRLSAILSASYPAGSAVDILALCGCAGTRKSPTIG